MRLVILRCHCTHYDVIVMVLLIGLFRSYDNALRWMPYDLTDDKSTLVQVMAWCRQVASHCLNHCWPIVSHHMVSLGHSELISWKERPWLESLPLFLSFQDFEAFKKHSSGMLKKEQELNARLRHLVGWKNYNIHRVTGKTAKCWEVFWNLCLN